MAQVEGSVGILLRSHGSSLIVAALTPAGPAADSGEVRVDDEITAVENVPVHCEPHSETIARLRGTVGSQVSVALRRHDAASGKLLSTLITLTRAEPEISLEKRAASSQRQTPQARFTQLQDDIRRLDRAGVHSQHSMQKGKAVWTPVDQNGIKTEMVTFEAARFATTREQDRFQSLPPAPDDLVPAQPQLTAQSPAPASALSWEPTIEAPTGPAQRRRTPDHSVLTDAETDQERNASSSNAMDSFLIPHRDSSDSSAPEKQRGEGNSKRAMYSHAAPKHESRCATLLLCYPEQRRLKGILSRSLTAGAGSGRSRLAAGVSRSICPRY